jgi:hypothetical protein
MTIPVLGHGDRHLETCLYDAAKCAGAGPFLLLGYFPYLVELARAEGRYVCTGEELESAIVPLPFRTQSCAAVVTSKLLEYMELPLVEVLLAECVRVARCTYVVLPRRWLTGTQIGQEYEADGTPRWLFPKVWFEAVARRYGATVEVLTPSALRDEVCVALSTLHKEGTTTC